MIDMHCHLDLYTSPGRVIAEADKREAFVLAVTTTPKAFLGNIRLTEGRKRIRVAVGLHPELVATRYQEVEDVRKFMAQTKYVGEIGIDGSAEHARSVCLQTEVFSTILTHAENYGGKILSIHSRGAATVVLDVIEKTLSRSQPVLHWFSGTRKELDRAIELGCWFSVGSPMFRSRKGRELLTVIPSNRLLTETDGPFATDGKKPLMPWDVSEMLPALTEIWKCSADEADKRLHINLRELLGRLEQESAA